jgi:hypothetical protein
VKVITDIAATGRRDRLAMANPPQARWKLYLPWKSQDREIGRVGFWNARIAHQGVGKPLIRVLGFGCLAAVGHRTLKPAYPFADTFSQLWQFLGTENEQRDSEDDNQVHGLK